MKILTNKIGCSIHTLRKAATFGASAAAILALATSAHANNLVLNGGFESNTGNGQIGYNTTVTDWSVSNGYAFLYAPGTADTTGANGQFGNLSLWGPGNGSANGLPATSPAGGYYVALDGDFQQAPITQSISGLTVGDQYNVSFYYGGAQQNGFTGDTTEGFDVSFGGETLDTPILSDVSHGFTGWQSETMTFTADNTTDLLQFLAVGTPSGLPPFTVLDGVSVSPIPEPSTLPLLITGLVSGLGALRMRKWLKR